LIKTPSLTACTGKTETLAKSKPKLSWIEPFFELRLEALEHLFFDISDVSELAPTSRVTVFGKVLDLHEKLFDQRQPVPVFFPQMLFAKLSSLFLPVLGS
jgi:hypothetical protein